MEHTKYEALVNEGRNLWTNSKQAQARLMVILKTVQDDGCLDTYCEDIGLSPATAKNYLAAYDKFLDLGFVPGSGDGVDQTIVRMWEDVYDPTLFDPRYGSVDRDGVDAAADELGLRGPTKAYDIAKNPNSMKAAIIGDGRAASAAVEALIARAKTDPLIAIALRASFREHPPRPLDRPRKDGDQIVRDALHDLDSASINLTEIDVPNYMADLVATHVETNIGRLHNVVTIMKGKGVLQDL